LGYEIRIGERAVPAKRRQRAINEVVAARGIKDAPLIRNSHCTLPGQNSAQASAVNWTDFCDEVGLYDLFFGRLGLMPHSVDTKVTAIFDRDHHKILSSLSRYRASHPGVEPEMGGSDESATLARLVWLEFWFRWAIANCKQPSFVFG
jgi:hypothetical protein